jgi:senataxin
LQSRVIKILLYEEVQPSDTVDLTKMLEEGNIMVGHFRLSWNYFTVKPNEVYAFN